MPTPNPPNALALGFETADCGPPTGEAVSCRGGWWKGAPLPGGPWNELRKPDCGIAWIDRNLLGKGRSSELYYHSRISSHLKCKSKEIAYLELKTDTICF